MPFSDLVARAMPALVPYCHGSGTEGRSWEWTIKGFVNPNGTDIDMSGGTVTGTCQILDRVDGTVLLSLTVTPGVGAITVSAIPSETANLANGQEIRACVWRCHLVGPSSRQVQVWTPRSSRFMVEAN